MEGLLTLSFATTAATYTVPFDLRGDLLPLLSFASFVIVVHAALEIDESRPSVAIRGDAN